MPLPICPAPTTPIFRSPGAAPVSGRSRASRSLSRSAIRSDISAAARLAKLFFELRQDLEQIADKAVIRDLENGRFLVLVDGDDDLGILHARQVLDRAGNPDGDIQIGRDDLPG